MTPVIALTIVLTLSTVGLIIASLWLTHLLELRNAENEKLKEEIENLDALLVEVTRVALQNRMLTTRSPDRLFSQPKGDA